MKEGRDRPAPTWTAGSPDDVAHRKTLQRRAMLSICDFAEALADWGFQEAINLADDGQGKDLEAMEKMVRRTLRAAAVVAYARPFLRSYTGLQDSKAQDRLFLGDLGDFGEEWMRLHDQVIALRDTFIAHADGDVRAPKLKAQFDGDRGTLTLSMTHYWQPLDGLDFNRVAQLITLMRERAQHLAASLASQLHEEGLFQNDDFEDWAGGSSTMLMKIETNRSGNSGTAPEKRLRPA